MREARLNQARLSEARLNEARMNEALPELRGRVGMVCLIAAEAAIFTIFVVAYVFYIGKSITGPQPRDVLHAPVLPTICLLSSSVTVHAGVRALRRGSVAGFTTWWLLTLMLGAVFLGGTLGEWQRLIYDEGLTIQTNLFGTTYYSLVGLHAFHVVVGVTGLALASILGLLGYVTPLHASRSDVFSLYWHFVDAVWVVVFLVVYVAGR
jgi:cytochrome c oxidase subunit III